MTEKGSHSARIKTTAISNSTSTTRSHPVLTAGSTFAAHLKSRSGTRGRPEPRTAPRPPPPRTGSPLIAPGETSDPAASGTTARPAIVPSPMPIKSRESGIHSSSAWSETAFLSGSTVSRSSTAPSLRTTGTKREPRHFPGPIRLSFNTTGANSSSKTSTFASFPTESEAKKEPGVPPALST